MFIPRKTYEALVAENESLKTANGKLTSENVTMFQQLQKRDPSTGRFTKK